MKKLLTNLISFLIGRFDLDPSDGYHSFQELYRHRNRLLLELLKNLRSSAVWMSRLHSDGTSFSGYFIVGYRYQQGLQFSYHLPLCYWDECLTFARLLDRAPAWDGHSSEEVLIRLSRLKSAQNSLV